MAKAPLEILYFCLKNSEVFNSYFTRCIILLEKLYIMYMQKKICLQYCTDQLGLREIAFPPQVFVHRGNRG